MNTPFNSHAWRELQDQAAAQLPHNFADQVLREARRSGHREVSGSWLSNPFTISAATAALCLTGVMFIHGYLTQEANERHMADWQEISQQTASLDLSP